MSVKIIIETEEPIKKIVDALAEAGLKITKFELTATNYPEGVITGE